MKKGKERKRGFQVGLAMVLVPLLGLGVVSLYRLVWQPFPIYLEFEEARKLNPGDFLYLKGLRIGEVMEVKLQPSGKVRVKVDLKKEYRKTLRRDSAFLIVNDKLITGKKCIEGAILDAGSPPVTKGETLEGCDSFLDFWLRLGGAMVDWDGIGLFLRDLAERAGQKWSEVDWQKARDQIQGKVQDTWSQIERDIEDQAKRDQKRPE